MLVLLCCEKDEIIIFSVRLSRFVLKYEFVPDAKCDFLVLLVELHVDISSMIRLARHCKVYKS